MARITTVAKAQKDQGRCHRCGHEIKTGESYKWFANRIGRSSIRKVYCASCHPRPSDMTTSDKLCQLYMAQESVEDSIAATSSLEDLPDLAQALRDAAEQAREVAEAYRESVQNMPEQFQQGDQAMEMEEKADNCESWADSLESAADEVESLAEADREAKDEDERENDGDDCENETVSEAIGHAESAVQELSI